MENIAEQREKISAHVHQKTGIRLASDTLLEALTHSSAKELGLPCNERLEFLGDAVLGQIACEHLYRAFPEREEGALSVMKSVLVSANILSQVAKKLELDAILITGKGINKHKLPRSLLANVLEALIAAIYLEAGFDAAKEFIIKFVLTPYLDEVARDEVERNYKSLLQDYAQKNNLPLPSYQVTKEVGPDHRKRFQIVVEVNKIAHGPTWGYSKKEAEQKVAMIALKTLGVLS
jgi:ribonuclease-3